MAQMVKNMPAMWETRVQSLGWEDPLEKGMATDSSVLAWKIPWKRNLAGYSPWCHKKSDSTEGITLSLQRQTLPMGWTSGYFYYGCWVRD